MIDLARPLRTHDGLIKRVAPLTLLVLLLSLTISQVEPGLQTRRPGQRDQAAWARAALARAPLMFVENVGQLARAARYTLYGSSTGLTLAQDGLWLTIHDRQPTPIHAGDTDVSQ